MNNDAILDLVEDASSLEDQSQRPLPMQVKGRIIHVDGDFLAYASSGSGDMSVADCLYNVKHRLDKFRLYAGAEKIRVHLTADWSHKGYRYKIATVKPYQAGREGQSKPKNWRGVRDYLEGLPYSSIWGDREADDAIALAMTARPGDVMVMKDKDGRMIHGKHLKWDTLELIDVPAGVYSLVDKDGLQYGYKWFWLQMLQGDTVDGIPGLEFRMYYGQHRRGVSLLKKGLVGPATAEDILAPARDNKAAYFLVSREYEKTYGDGWEDRFVEQAALLWLRRTPVPHPYDFYTQLADARFSEGVAAATSRLTKRLGL